ncbi:dihydropteroate synthase [Cytophagales bacterium LB-30]|uniref:dihydropteroate synthase n=1 Tax=Shiella aurantiaca TaxID=3058365 RepID=A0ABT8F3U9_9BACT|nr:dihydropteroate synthase [Shiella aurantiaca]MDN4164676.1 dihydropteroate synthase [Shiella aurantiaca]
MEAKDKAFLVKRTLNVRGRLVDLSQPQVMGIINATPDSFYSGSRVSDMEAIVERAGTMLQEGALFLDIGGYSTRPGAAEVSVAEEAERVLPAIEAFAKYFPEAILSIDTFRAEVARQALAAGAHIVNDVSGGDLEEAMWQVVADAQAVFCLMHMRGTPQNMAQKTEYTDVVKEVMEDLARKCQLAIRLGIHDFMIDPGIGFAKTVEQNYAILKNLAYFQGLKAPLLLGVSRKSLIWRPLSVSAEQALNGTTALHMHALQQGANILRVHDVKEAKECIELFKLLQD